MVCPFGVQAGHLRVSSKEHVPLRPPARRINHNDQSTFWEHPLTILLSAFAQQVCSNSLWVIRRSMDVDAKEMLRIVDALSKRALDSTGMLQLREDLLASACKHKSQQPKTALKALHVGQTTCNMCFCIIPFSMQPTPFAALNNFSVPKSHKEELYLQASSCANCVGGT